MVIFIDESGIHKTTDHSAFALVYVTMEDRQQVEEGVLEIERTHPLKPFHWVDQPWKLREVFIREVSRLPFQAKVAVFQNPFSPSQALEWSLLHVIVEKHLKLVVIDGEKPKWVERKLKKVLRDKGISVKKLKTMRRDSSPGLRRIDALAGLTRSHYDDPEGKTKEIWKGIEKKITAHLVGGQATG